MEPNRIESEKNTLERTTLALGTESTTLNSKYDKKEQ